MSWPNHFFIGGPEHFSTRTNHYISGPMRFNSQAKRGCFEAIHFNSGAKRFISLAKNDENL